MVVWGGGVSSELSTSLERGSKLRCSSTTALMLVYSSDSQSCLYRPPGVYGDQQAFDQVSEFDIGRILAYRYCGLSFREIGSRVGRNQTTVMWICDRYMQEGSTDRGGQSHPPQCTTSMSARIIRRRVLQSGLPARCPLLGVPLWQNHRRLHHQWCDKRMIWVAEWNKVVFTDEPRICLLPSDGRILVWRHRAERMLNIYLCYTPPHWSCTEYYGMGCYWISI
ncbi:transposable element Tcb1 transposase [Trichonephila clavipes]|uniref:Transposable element Tcb1 transposase n=1 Tax=Trichonephila clavipes TaxID=2585209 RepID=A0A8X6VIT6_TRICX|nr:transposable element Tcb1 transposase [Trichonephila clavipes]